MSKRIILTDREVSHIIRALKEAKVRVSIDYAVSKSGQDAYDDIIDRLSRPVKKEPTS